MVDHNESRQAVKGIEDAEILEILVITDLVRLKLWRRFTSAASRLAARQPSFIRCTKKMELKFRSRQRPAVRAIISDTLLFRSPTCTAIDRYAATELGKLAGIELETFAREMFAAGSNLKNKTAEQIFFQDYKRFSMEEKK